MQWSEDGIVLGTRQHGEADVILEVMTRKFGRHLGLVHGGRSRRQRPVLQPGNTLSLTWRARLDEHLGHFRAEPLVERASAIMASPSATFGIQTLAAHLRLLPERDPHPRLYDALAVVADHLAEPRRAGELMIRFELLLLEDLGFGLDLSRCAATGADTDLVFVSPKSGRAVGAEAGAPYADRLLPLPAFLREGVGAAPPESQALSDGFRLTGFFLERHVTLQELPGGQAREGFVRSVLRED